MTKKSGNSVGAERQSLPAGTQPTVGISREETGEAYRALRDERDNLINKALHALTQLSSFYEKHDRPQRYEVNKAWHIIVEL